MAGQITGVVSPTGVGTPITGSPNNNDVIFSGNAPNYFFALDVPDPLAGPGYTFTLRHEPIWPEPGALVVMSVMGLMLLGRRR